MHVPNLNSARHKVFIRFLGEAIPFMFRDCEIEGALDRLSFRSRPQNLLRPLYLPGIETEVLVRPCFTTCHPIALVTECAAVMYTSQQIVNMGS